MSFEIIKTEKNVSERSIEIDLIRTLCCMMVVIIHMPQFYSDHIRIIVNTLTHCAVPCFMAISGYLIFFRCEYTYRQVLYGPFRRYSIIFMSWISVYIINSYLLTDKEESFWRYALINSEGWHLWYLKVYLQIIVVYPFVKVITRRKDLTILYSILWFVFLPVRFTLGHIPGVEFTFLRVIQLPFFQYSGSIGGTVLGYYPMECMGIFIAGGGILNYIEKLYEKEKYSEKLKCKLLDLVLIGLLGFAIALTVTYSAFRIDISLYLASLTCFHFYFIMMAVGLLAGIYLLCLYIGSNNKLCRLNRVFVDKTLGIYIIHPLICSLINKWPFIVYMEEGYDKNGVITILTLVISFFVVTIIHWIVPRKIVKYIF